MRRRSTATECLCVGSSRGHFEARANDKSLTADKWVVRFCKEPTPPDLVPGPRVPLSSVVMGASAAQCGRARRRGAAVHWPSRSSTRGCICEGGCLRHELASFLLNEKCPEARRPALLGFLHVMRHIRVGVLAQRGGRARHTGCGSQLR